MLLCIQYHALNITQLFGHNVVSTSNGAWVRDLHPVASLPTLLIA